MARRGIVLVAVVDGTIDKELEERPVREREAPQGTRIEGAGAALEIGERTDMGARHEDAPPLILTQRQPRQHQFGTEVVGALLAAPDAVEKATEPGLDPVRVVEPEGG